MPVIKQPGLHLKITWDNGERGQGMIICPLICCQYYPINMPETTTLIVKALLAGYW